MDNLRVVYRSILVYQRILDSILKYTITVDIVTVDKE